MAITLGARKVKGESSRSTEVASGPNHLAVPQWSEEIGAYRRNTGVGWGREPGS